MQNVKFKTARQKHTRRQTSCVSYVSCVRPRFKANNRQNSQKQPWRKYLPCLPYSHYLFDLDAYAAKSVPSTKISGIRTQLMDVNIDDHPHKMTGRVDYNRAEKLQLLFARLFHQFSQLYFFVCDQIFYHSNSCRKLFTVLRCLSTLYMSELSIEENPTDRKNSEKQHSDGTLKILDAIFVTGSSRTATIDNKTALHHSSTKLIAVAEQSATGISSNSLNPASGKDHFSQSNDSLQGGRLPTLQERLESALHHQMQLYQAIDKTLVQVEIKSFLDVYLRENSKDLRSNKNHMSIQKQMHLRT
uniref:Uncharacterized protein n=1 Tax=Romanomermis culicivorax TaxID=13658 RepID=A0A915IDH9_ROMCU